MPSLAFLSIVSTSAIQVANKSAGYYVAPEIVWLLSLLPLVIVSVLVRQKEEGRSGGMSGWAYWSMLILGQGLAPSLYFMAMDITALMSQSLVYSIYPVGVIAWLSLSKKERINGRQWVCVVLIFAIQAWLILDTTTFGISTSTGVLLLLGSAACLIAQKAIYHGIRGRLTSKVSQQRLAQHGIMVSVVFACSLLVASGNLQQIPLFVAGEIAGSNTVYVYGLIAFVSGCYLANHLIRNYLFGTRPYIGLFLLLMSTPFFAYLFNQALFVNFPEQANMLLASNKSFLLMLSLPSIAFIYTLFSKAEPFNYKKAVIWLCFRSCG